MDDRFHDAPAEYLARIERALVAARVVADARELGALHASDPWRFQVNERDDFAALGIWRDHMSLLSVDVLWCASRRIPRALARAMEVASEQRLTDVVSPPVPLEEAGPYRSAGMRPFSIVSTYQLTRAAPKAAGLHCSGLEIRNAGRRDIPALLELDGRCFEPFWRYDQRHLKAFQRTACLRIAERDGEPVGYTLCTAAGEEGLLGRLCVSPGHRRQGVATALLADAVQREWDRGADRVMLSTQTDNAAAQALYRAARFRDTGRRYAFLTFGAQGDGNDS